MYIGIDAGGTKTDILICDKNGHPIARDISDGINAARSGAEAAAAHFAQRIKSLNIPTYSLYVGAAGAGSPAIANVLTEKLRALLPDIPRIAVRSDAFNALNGEVNTGNGLALIAGTGSCAFQRINGEIRQIGGRGSLIDDGGSGFWAGKACLNATYRHIDGRGRPTSLTAAVEEKLGMPLADAIPAIYSGGPGYIASFAPLVFEHAAKGDGIARMIAAKCLAELTLLLKAGLHEDINICVASGGMFKNEYLRRELTVFAVKNKLKLIFPTVPPVCGAVISAHENACDCFIENVKTGVK